MFDQLESGEPELWRFLAAQNCSLEWVIPDVLEDAGHRMHAAMRAVHAAVAPDLVDCARSHPVFQLRFGAQTGERQDYWARIIAIDSALHEAFQAHRVLALRTQNDHERPAPYDHPELGCVTPDDDYLVTVQAAQHDGSIPVGSVICQATLTTPSPNSMYWAMSELGGLACERKVRLDPLFVCPANEYRQVMYRMTVYGAPLDWKRLATLREPLQGKWIPDPGRHSDVEYTEVVWTPRDDGVHFACEEVPKPGLTRLRGARYFHSVYHPQSATFVHADGALRLYSEAELSLRAQVHLRRGGRVGTRAKVFTANGRIEREAWCRLVAAFFVWNADVQAYVGGREMPFDAAGS